MFELHELEKNYFRKLTNYKVPLKAGKPDTLAKREADQKLEQEEIDNSRPLTEEEKARKEELLTQGFSLWNRRDFQHFVSLLTKYGRNLISLIAHEFPEKTIDEVRAYAKAFWRRYKEIEGFDKYLHQIEQGEEKIVKVQVQKESLRRKISQYKYPLQELVLRYPPAATNKRVFSEEEDRFLLVQLYRFGLDLPDVYERIRQAIRELPLFQFDFFFQSRNTGELSRRCLTLLACVLKEIYPDQLAGQKRKRDQR